MGLFGRVARIASGAVAFAWLGLLSACTPSVEPPAAGPAVMGNAVATGETLGNGTVRIALLLPSSGPGNAPLVAVHLKNAVQLALREFSGANLQVLVKDDKGTAEGARLAAAEAISQGAELILGPLFSQSVGGAASIARPAGVPIIAFSTDTSVAARNVYLLSFLPQGDVERIVGFAAARGKRSVAALLPASGYGTVVEAALQKYGPAANMRVVGIERYEADRGSMQHKVEAIAPFVQGGQADTLFMPDSGLAVPVLAELLAAKGIQSGATQWLGSGQWDDPRIQQTPALRGGWYAAPDKSGFGTFAGRYQAAFGAPPLRIASLAYDATSLAAGLAARYGDQRFAAERLTNPNGFIGVDGVFRFLPDGTNQRGLAIYEVGAGTATIIDPAPRSFSRTGI